MAARNALTALRRTRAAVGWTALYRATNAPLGAPCRRDGGQEYADRPTGWRGAAVGWTALYRATNAPQGAPCGRDGGQEYTDRPTEGACRRRVDRALSGHQCAARRAVPARWRPGIR